MVIVSCLGLAAIASCTSAPTPARTESAAQFTTVTGTQSGTAPPLGVRLVRDPQTHTLYYSVKNDGPKPANVTVSYKPDDPLAPMVIASDKAACSVQPTGNTCTATLEPGEVVTVAVDPAALGEVPGAGAGDRSATTAGPGSGAGDKAVPKGKIVLTAEADGGRTELVQSESSTDSGGSDHRKETDDRLHLQQMPALSPNLLNAHVLVAYDALSRLTKVTLTNVTKVPLQNVTFVADGTLNRSGIRGDLPSTISVSDSSVNSGQLVEFRAPIGMIRVTNHQPALGAAPASQSALTWKVGTLAAGASATLTMKAVSKTGAPATLVAHYEADGIVPGFLALPVRPEPRSGSSPSPSGHTSTAPAGAASGPAPTATAGVSASTSTTTASATSAHSTAAQFRVTEISLRADPTDHTGPCPATITFSGRITTSGKGGTVSYRFIRSDGASSTARVLRIDSTGYADVTDTWTLGAKGQTFKGWEQLEVLSPQAMTSSQAPFVIHC